MHALVQCRSLKFPPEPRKDADFDVTSVKISAGAEDLIRKVSPSACCWRVSHLAKNSLSLSLHSVFDEPDTIADLLHWHAQLLVKHPKERMELHNVLQHPWIVGNANPAVLR